MARYLDPAKIGLLVLVEVYADEAVPNDASLPVLSFVTSHLLDSELATSSPGLSDRWSKTESTVRLVASIKDFEQLLSPFSAAAGPRGRCLWDIFLQKLWDIDSLDALHSFFAQRQGLLARSKEELGRSAESGAQPPARIRLSLNSPLGIFVRRSQLEFTRLRFHDATDLWEEFVRYRQPTATYRKRRDPSFGRLSFDNVLLTGEHEWGGDSTDALASVTYSGVPSADAHVPGSVSTDDVERLLEFQIEQMQKFGTRTPPDVRDRFRHLLRDSYLVPSLSHYLEFLDAWRSGDYPSSFDYLHRYFDYTMQNRDRLFYQYALLNLAILQADFGCYKEAVDAMLEAVSTARENRDVTCLNFSLNWLFHFGRAHPQLVSELESNSMLGNGKESLAFLRLKAKETGNWILWSSALLSEAKVILSNGDSVAAALEHIVRSSRIIVEKNLKPILGSYMSMNIALWDRLGITPLSAMTCEIFLRCHAHNAVFEDELRVTCRIASLLAGRGEYAEAFAKLESIDGDSLRAWKARQYWQKMRGLIKLTRELNRDNLDGADYLLSQLLQSKSEDLEPDMAFIVDSLHVDFLARRGDLTTAFDKVNALLDSLQQDTSDGDGSSGGGGGGVGAKDISVRIRLLLIKAHLLDLAGRPQRGFTLAARAAGLAWRARLMPHLWQAVGALAGVLISVSEFNAAAALLSAAIPRCLECDSSAVAGALLSRLADAHMGQAGGSAGSTRAEALAQAHEALGASQEHFAAIGDVVHQGEMLAKNATVMRMLGNDALAEDYAARYLALREDASTAGR